MYRSASWNRDGDDYYMHRMADDYYSSQSSVPGLRTSFSMEESELPAYDPMVEMSKKEKSGAKVAENAVHVIPLVLLLCGFILWFLSNPDVAVAGNVESVSARIEGLTIEGDIHTDSDGTQTGFLPLDSGDSDTSKQTKDHHKGSRKLANKLT